MIDKLKKALHRLEGYPNFEGRHPMAVIYEWLAEAGFAEHRIYEVLGPRGYLKAATYVALNPTEEAFECLGNSIEETFYGMLAYEEDGRTD
jgi:hypothetical protein